MTVNPEKVRANGLWVLVRPEEKDEKQGSLYLPDGNVMERLGHTVARVLSSGGGAWEKHAVTGKDVFHRPEVKAGDRVVFRGHLSEANRVGDDCCFIHHRDLIGTLAEDAVLDLALPYDN